jgi:putative ABC transport system ATP-binding protein
MNDILMVKNLRKTFQKKGRKVKALRSINITIKEGEYISIQGPSGSGKTTLLNMLGCLDQPTAGKLVIDGINVAELNGNKLSRIRSEKIGFIFQDFCLIPILNAVENVELPMELIGLSKEERRKKAEELLRLVGLGSRMKHRPGELSAGEQQRVAVARSLANSPAIILADEPTGNLDSKSSKRIMDLLNRLNEELGTTIIVVTHDDKMARLTKKLVYIKDGQISRVQPLREDGSYEITTKLDISPRLVNVLMKNGYDELEKVISISEVNVKLIKKLKRKNRQQILNRINRYKSRKNT